MASEAVDVERLAKSITTNPVHRFLRPLPRESSGLPMYKRDLCRHWIRAALIELTAQGFCIVPAPRALATLDEAELAAEARRRHERLQDVIAEQQKRKGSQ